MTEDFALGMRLRAHTPPFSGMYLPLQLVRGTAPDTIRAAFKQRSRWTKVLHPVPTQIVCYLLRLPVTKLPCYLCNCTHDASLKLPGTNSSPMLLMQLHFDASLKLHVTKSSSMSLMQLHLQCIP